MEPDRATPAAQPSARLPATPILETERLVLRPLRQDDAPAIQERVSAWEVVKYLATAPWPYPDDGAETFVRDIALPAVAAGKEMVWVVTLQPEQAKAAKVTEDTAVGLLSFTPGGKATGNRGFWLDPELQGQGYMTEAIVAFQDYIFLDLGYERIETTHAQSNVASRRVKEKTGGRFLRTEEMSFVNGEELCERWEVTQTAWLALSPCLAPDS